MNTKDPKLDSGSYINGVYTSKNGFTGSGLNCPKGTRLYNTETRCPIFFEPEDTAPGEEFKKITSDIAPDIRTIKGGTLTHNDVNYSIHAGSKALNFDGSVNYTVLELI